MCERRNKVLRLGNLLSVFFFPTTMFCFFFVVACVAKRKSTERKMLLFRGDGEFSFLFWSSVFDLLLGATVNMVAMATAAEEAKTYVIEVCAAV